MGDNTFPALNPFKGKVHSIEMEEQNDENGSQRFSPDKLKILQSYNTDT